MATIDSISIAGIQSLPLPETRPLVHIDVSYNGKVYNWLVYLPPDNDLNTFLGLDSTKVLIQADIDAKELEWTNLNPKTRTVINPEDGTTTEVPILYSEIVTPDLLDYVALRRNSYPSLADQLGAIWKGSNDPEYARIASDIQAVKLTYEPILRPPVTGLDIDKERDRRRFSPMSVTLPKAGTFSVNMDVTSQANIQALTTIGMYLAQNAPSQITTFRDYKNIEHSLEPLELISMGLQVAGFIQTLYKKSWALKAMAALPIDYFADSYWT
jgi:hypothetical protein